MISKGNRVAAGARPGGDAGYSLVELMAAMAITLFVMAAVYALMLQNQAIYERQTRLVDLQQASRVAMDLMTREVRGAGSDPSERAFSPENMCTTGTYKTPLDYARPVPDDVAPVTVASAGRLRVKQDRPMWAPYGQDGNLNLPSPTPPPNFNACRGGPTQNKLDMDDEDLMGDGFLNDEGEDVEYWWTGDNPPAGEPLRTLYRIERRRNPNAACRPCPVKPAESTSKQPIAGNVVKLLFKYYDTDAPTAHCPGPETFLNEAAYETAQDVCDPPLVLNPACKVTIDGKDYDQPCDLSTIRRVRIKLWVEGPKLDSLTHKTNQITLASEVTLRNRNM